MKEPKEVKNLRNKILGMEMELCNISVDLERYKRDYTHNIKILKSLDENIEFLKSSRSAVSILEFKKIKLQKELVIKRIVHYQNKIKPLQKALDQKEFNHKEEMKRFEEIYKLQFENNILEFPNGRKEA